MRSGNTWKPACVYMYGYGSLLNDSFHKPADQIWKVRNLPLWRLGCWCSSSSGGTVARSYVAPLKRRGLLAGQRGRDGSLGVVGPSAPPVNHQGKCFSHSQDFRLMVWSGHTNKLITAAHTCWSSSSSLQSVQTFRRLMHGSTTVLPSSTTYTAFCPSQ